MPKGKKKNERSARGPGRRAEASSDSDDEPVGSVLGDNASVVSMQGSDNGSAIQEVGVNAAVDNTSAEELFENKLKDAIELATQKSAAGRTKALEALCQGLLKRYAPDFLEGRRATISDLVEKGLKRGKGAECVAAARLALLLALQLQDCEDVYKELRPILVQMLTDPSEQPVVRTAVSSALTGLCFVGGGEIAEVLNIMNVLEAIFTQSVPRK